MVFPTPLPSTLELLALASLATAFCVGLWRIEKVLVMNWNNFEKLDAGERVGQLTSKLINSSGSGAYLNLSNGDIVNEVTMKDTLIKQTYRKDTAEKNIETAKSEIMRLYRIRNTLLYFGFAAILLAKVLSPYLP